MSGFRSAAINRCVNGASRSKHLRFAALDLVATNMQDRRDLFADLCRMQNRIGQESEMGLGAYYDPAAPFRNLAGRFHIDADGFRTWGRDYTRRSNPCPQLLD